jgi:hypothetical protein
VIGKRECRTAATSLRASVRATGRRLRIRRPSRRATATAAARRAITLASRAWRCRTCRHSSLQLVGRAHPEGGSYGSTASAGRLLRYVDDRRRRRSGVGVGLPAVKQQCWGDAEPISSDLDVAWLTGEPPRPADRYRTQLEALGGAVLPSISQPRATFLIRGMSFQPLAHHRITRDLGAKLGDHHLFGVGVGPASLFDDPKGE